MKLMLTSGVGTLRRVSATHPLCLSLIFPTVLVALLCAIWTPFWETNDDVAMSMIAHGYGAVAYPSPNLVFSNVVWGAIVQAVPSVNGLVGYSIATFATIGIAHAGILYGLLLVGCGPIVSCLVVAASIGRATLFPQFTINAGLLAVAGVILLLAYAQNSKRLLLVLSSVALLGLAFLVRWMELVFVLLVAVPLFASREWLRMRPALIGMGGLVVACVAATAIDAAAYASDDWQAFKSFNAVRVAFTDYGAASYFGAHPELLARYGLTQNDLKLLGSFFIIDHDIANTAVLKNLLGELPALQGSTSGLERAVQSLSVFLHPSLIGLTFAAAALFFVSPTRRVLAAWLIFVACVVALGLLGRPGVTRVYYAPLVLLIVAPLVNLRPDGFRQWAPGAVMLLSAVSCWVLTSIESSRRLQQMNAVAPGLKKLPDIPIVAWGSSFPFEVVFPPLKPPPKLRVYALGTFSNAPFSTLIESERQGRGLLHLLRTGQTVGFVAGRRKIALLSDYAERRLRLTPVIEKLKVPKISIYSVRLDDKSGRSEPQQ